ncbi:MAG TPA: hypothetical protein VFA12_02550 [Stellaceae bacterium]|nr:hypothetical protein [Stellaceae bacterium]
MTRKFLLIAAVALFGLTSSLSIGSAQAQGWYHHGNGWYHGWGYPGWGYRYGYSYGPYYNYSNCYYAYNGALVCY